MTFHSTSNHLKINQLRDNTFSKRQYPFNLNIKNSSINKMPTNILNYFVIVPLNVSIFLSKFLQWRSQPYPILAQLRRSFLRFFSELWSILSKNIKLTVNIGHFEGQRETGSVFIFIGYYEVEQETGAKFVLQSNPIVLFDTISTQLHPVNTYFHPPNWRWQINDSYTK